MTARPSAQADATHTALRIRVLIADDHVVVREGLAAIIGRQDDMVVVGEASRGDQAIAMWAQFLPDVTLMDLRMPGVDGATALERIRTVNAAARVLVLTTFDTDNDVSRAIRAGARGYLLKDAPRDQLLNYIRRIHRGETCIPSEVVAKLASGLSSEDMTPRERGVLSLLAAGKSNKQIARALNIGETTVKSHLRGIFAKLNVMSRTEAIAMATRRGLIDR